MIAPSLIVSAFGPELAGLERDPPPGWTVGTVGIGAVAAAVGTAGLLAKHAPSRVLFVGTCGAYDQRLAVGDLLSAAFVLATSFEELSGAAYRPGAEATRWTPGFRIPLPEHGVAVPPAITRTAGGAVALGRVAAVENLELSGVFAACASAGVPVAAALAVANRVGPDAHGEWRRHHAEASQALVGALRATVLAG